jgi:hypothetical protein
MVTRMPLIFYAVPTLPVLLTNIAGILRCRVNKIYKYCPVLPSLSCNLVPRFKLWSKLNFEPCRSISSDTGVEPGWCIELTGPDSEQVLAIYNSGLQQWLMWSGARCVCVCVGGGGILVQKKRLFLETEAFQHINPMIDLPHATSTCFACLGSVSGSDEWSH